MRTVINTRNSSSKYRLNGRLKRTRVGAPRPEWRQGFVLPNSSGKLAMLAVTAAPRRASYGRRRDLLFVCWASQRWLNGGGNLSSGDVGNVRRVAMSRKSEIRRSKIPVLPIAFGISLSALLPASVAFACGGFLDAKCNLEHGGLSPGNIAKQTQKAGQDAANTVAKAGQDVANAINELQASVLSGPTLERAIIASHDTAINGAMPIPPLIRQQLTGYASEDSMDRVRFKIGDNGFANLAHLLEQGGAASAVTLIDVVVFRGPSEADDLSIWAHELTHVDQYREWGVHSFAVQYTRNWHSVEDPAYAKGNGYRAWAMNRGPVGPTVGGPPVGGQVPESELSVTRQLAALGQGRCNR